VEWRRHGSLWDSAQRPAQQPGQFRRRALRLTIEQHAELSVGIPNAKHPFALLDDGRTIA